MIGTLDLRHPPRIAPESARTLDQPSSANPPASQASAPWWSGQSGGRSQNGVDRPVADRGVSDVIWPTGRVAGGGHGSADAHGFPNRRGGLGGLIDGLWAVCRGGAGRASFQIQFLRLHARRPRAGAYNGYSKSGISPMLEVRDAGLSPSSGPKSGSSRSAPSSSSAAIDISCCAPCT